MKKLAPLRSLFLLVTLMLSWQGMAEEESQYLLTEKTYKALSSAQELMANEQLSEAEKKLNDLVKQLPAESYDVAVVRQTLGYLYSSQENYLQASKQFQLALDTHALPEKVIHDLHYNLAQLLLADDQYREGISLLEQWLEKEASPPNSAYVLIASAYYRVKEYKKTIKYINTAIKRDASAKESWYQILLSAHLELKQYKSAITVLEKVVPLYPYKKTYWAQLSALYLQQKKEFTGLAVKMLAQRLELGDSKILVNMADMYRYLHIPYKSAQLLSEGIESGVIQADIDNLNRLADSWLAAKEAERAADVLQQVVALDESGKTDLKLGRVLFGLEQWDKAAIPLDNSIQKLSDTKVGQAALLLGMTYFHLDDIQQAKRQFIKASGFDNERNQAQQWLRHIDNLAAGDTDES